MFPFFRILLALALAAPVVLIGCRKADERATPAVRVDTVRVVVRDTIYPPKPTPAVVDLPTDFSYLGAIPRKFAAGISVEVYYLSAFGGRLSSERYMTWKDPDAVTLKIVDAAGSVYYESDNPTYQRYTIGGTQYGLRILIPKSDIPALVYKNFSEHRYPIHIAVQYDERTYTTGEDEPTAAGLPADFAYLSTIPRKFAAGISIEVYYLSAAGGRLHSMHHEIWRNPDAVTLKIADGNGNVHYESDNPTYQRYTIGGTQYGLRILIPKSNIPAFVYKNFSEHRYPIHIAVEYDERTYTN